jgi:uncharacterized membrane protein YesL
MTWIIIAAIGGFVVGWIVAFITLPTIVRALTGSPHPREVKEYIAHSHALKAAKSRKPAK